MIDLSSYSIAGVKSSVLDVVVDGVSPLSGGLFVLQDRKRKINNTRITITAIRIKNMCIFFTACFLSPKIACTYFNAKRRNDKGKVGVLFFPPAVYRLIVSAEGLIGAGDYFFYCWLGIVFVLLNEIWNFCMYLTAFKAL